MLKAVRDNELYIFTHPDMRPLLEARVDRFLTAYRKLGQAPQEIKKLRKDGTLDVAVMAHEMTQCLVDMIMEQDEHHHAQLLALMILSLGDEYLQRTGIGERRDN